MMYRHPSNPRSQPDPSSRKKTTKSPPHKNPPPKNGLPPKNPIASRSKGRNDTPTITENSSPTDFINNAIHEYLLYREMNGTLDHFKAEVGKKSPEGRNIDPNVETQLMDAFEKGQREAFFRKWNSCIPANIRLKDEFCSKLEFYLHLYFVVFQIHPFTKKPAPKGAKAKPGQEPDKAEVQFFKHYLDTKGHKLAQTSEFLQFYALPYIPNPLTHPSFKDVFTREWLMELKGKLQSFVIEVVSSEQLPLVYQMYNTYARSLGEGGENGALGIRNDEEYNKVVGQLESSNQRLMNILQEYNEKYENVVKNYEIVKRNEEIVRSHLFESNAKWISFLKEVIVLTSESFQVIDTLKKGVTIPENIIDGLKNKLQRYETFLNSNQEELFNTSQDNSFIDKASTSQEMGTPDHSTISNMNRFQLDEKPVAHQSQYPPLNFEKVKSFLVNPNNNEANTAALLQALGWRITKTPGMSMRREVIISYSKNDLLDLHRKEPCVIESLMRSNSRRVKESTARLINILTLDYSGRSYLLGSDKLVIMLINSLKQEEGDSVIRKNCLGALQKLSLRRRPQLLMIEQDMIKWIVMTLKKEKESLSEYSYEYATALFMNLSLRSMGKKKCEELELEVLKVLNDLLEHENMQVRSFVNGTLYSLLSKPVFKEHAKALGMNDILEYLMQNSDERYRKQIQYILEQLNTDKMVDDDAQSDTNDEDNDYDDMEDEDDFGEDEYIEENPNNPNVLTGEELLRKHFSLAAEPGQMNYTIQESAAESRSQTATLRTKVDPQTPLNRPTTPSMLTKIMQKENVVRPEGFETKPKIPRTPAELTREGFYGNQSQSQPQPQQPHYFVEQRSSYMNYETYQRPPQQTQQYPTQGKPADTSQRSSQQQNDRKMSNEQDRRQSLNRMPLEENRQSFDNSQPMSQPSRNVETPGKEHKKAMGEDYEAFEAKPKIPRSPPDNMQRRR